MSTTRVKRKTLKIASLYRKEIGKPFEQSLRMKNIELPHLNGYIGNVNHSGFDSMSPQRIRKNNLSSNPNIKKHLTKKHFEMKKHDLNESVRFKLPELSTENTSIKLGSKYNSRHHSIKAFKSNLGSSPDLSPNKLTKNALYSGTMGKIKKNFKKHLMTLEKQMSDNPSLGRSPLRNDIRLQELQGSPTDKLNATEIHKPVVSIDIEQAKEAFRKNPYVQNRMKEQAEAVNRKKKHFKKIKRRKVRQSKQILDESYEDDFNDIDDIEDDDNYLQILLDDVQRKSTTSFYATTPENGNEFECDEELAGKEAIFNAQTKFKSYKKIKERQNLAGEEPKFSLVEFLESTDDHKILPKTLGLVKKKPVEQSYALEDVKTIFVGKQYAEPFSEGIKMISKVKNLNLTSSDLHGDMMLPILKKVPKSLEGLNISYNYNLTPSVFKMLNSIMEDKQRW